MATYIALLRKEAKSDFGVDFPDFPGCVTGGRTLEEARIMAAEALGLHLEGMVGDGDEIPAPSTLDQVTADPANADAVPFLVTVRDPQPKAVRVNVSFPPDVLEQIDEAAERESLSRSAFLAKAALARARAAAPKRGGRQRRRGSSRAG